jgi:hypothetical protein
MMGTFGGALQARHSDASKGKLTADVTGEVEAEEGVLVIRRIHVAMRLKRRRLPNARTSSSPMHGPLYRTLHKTIQLTSALELAAETKG